MLQNIATYFVLAVMKSEIHLMYPKKKWFGYVPKRRMSNGPRLSIFATYYVKKNK